MKKMKPNNFALILTLLVFILNDISGQDTLITRSGLTLSVQVIKQDEKFVYYRSYRGLNENMYQIPLKEVRNFKLQFPLKETEENQRKNGSYKIKEPNISETAKGHKVFIDSDDLGVNKTASYEIGKWGYWIVVKDIRNADYILRFTYKNGIFYGKGFTEIINPSTEQVLMKVYCSSKILLSLNSKRSIIRKLIIKELIPRFDKPEGAAW